MRKLIIYLVLAAMVLSGCTKQVHDKNTTIEENTAPTVIPVIDITTDNSTETAITTPADYSLEGYIEQLEEMELPKREFGTENSVISNDGDLGIRILYPVTEIAELDSEIEDWINSIIDECSASMGDSIEEKQAEITVEYNSYLVGNKFAGIKFSGVFNASFLAHPVDIVKTFNCRIDTKEILDIRSMLTETAYDTFVKFAAESIGVSEENIDEEFLDCWVITDKGIEFIFPRGKYLSMAEGEKSILVAYEMFEELVEIDRKDNENITDDDNKEIEGIAVKEVEIDPERPVIAITFDDGPGRYTDRLLDIFEKEDCQATFFLIGNMVEGRKDTVLRMAKEGHEIAGHSWNHRNLTELSPEEMADQIMMTKAAIYEASGYEAELMRPPYGAYNDVLKQMAKETGVSLVNWSVDTVDWESKNAEAVREAMLKDVKDGAIILCHDIYESTVDAIEKVLPELKEQGYQIVTVSKLLTYDGKELEDGEIYFKKLKEQ